MLPDNADAKWQLSEHTAAKHDVLIRYIKAWLPILGYSARRGGRRANLVLTDGFAGRGKYLGEEHGSPLLLLEVASELVRNGVVDEVEVFLVESNHDNWQQLQAAVEATPSVDGVKVNGPRESDFSDAARIIIDDRLRKKPRPSFWFLDPFGFAGMPLELVGEILKLRQAETLITFMIRDINRFLTDAQHRPAVSEILGLRGEELDAAIKRVLSSPSREVALRELYEERLKSVGAKYVWPFRVAARSSQDTIYYLIHASTHPKAIREMKEATKEVGGWHFAFLGRDDFSHTGQLELPEFGPDDVGQLKNLLLQTFAGREIVYEDLLNEAVPHRRFFWWIDKDLHGALQELAREGRVTKIPVTSKTQRGLADQDRLQFPTAN